VYVNIVKVASGQRTHSDHEGDIHGRAPIELEVGEIIGVKYSIERLLGRGGMGTVWLCQHLGLGERVAVKVMSRQVADHSEVRARFAREARASAKIKSRYVARVYDTGELPDGRPYLVMEYMEGETLGQALRTARTMSLEETARILGQVGRGLARAHELGIVHRDIKPDNVFLAHTADDGVIAKVFDFGIVKVSDALAMAPETTQEGALLGTPQYMSPEQVEGVAIDLRSDIYSLGVMAFRMLTGRRLFPDESLSATLMKICNGPLPSLIELLPGLPPAVEEWFQRACARDREARFPSALACVDALASAAGVAAKPDLTIPPAGAVTVSGVVPANSSRPLETPTGPSATPWTPPSGMNIAPAEAPRSHGTAAIVLGVAFVIVAAILLVVLSRGTHTPAAAPTVAAVPVAPAATLPTSAPTPALSASPPDVEPSPAASAAQPDASPRPGARTTPARRPARPAAPSGSSAPDERIHDVGY